MSLGLENNLMAHNQKNILINQQQHTTNNPQKAAQGLPLLSHAASQVSTQDEHIYEVKFPSLFFAHALYSVH